MSVVAADSWLVTGGQALGLDLHRRRFFAGLEAGYAADSGHPDLIGSGSAARFWAESIAAIPGDGDWFPRVELSSGTEDPGQDATVPDATRPQLRFLLRPAPARTRSVVVATHRGPDPRRTPAVKGPDLERLGAARAAVEPLGAGEVVILSEDGYVVEGGYSALLWWRGDILCGPPAEFPRVDSVTARTVLTVARALGVDTYEEAVTPAELDGTEVWALSALHGIRIVTGWIDPAQPDAGAGPATAELPGRLQTWRDRLDALRRPIHQTANPAIQPDTPDGPVGPGAGEAR